MPSKDRDRDSAVDAEERPKEKRRSSKSERGKTDGERSERGDKTDRDSPSSHRHRHKSSRSSRSSRGAESDVNSSTSHTHRRHKARDDRPAASSMTDLGRIPELDRSTDRISLPYPTFSKAHSREDVTTTTRARRTDPLTPEATDISAADMRRSKSVDHTPASTSAGRKASSSQKTPRGSDERPPSPPDTNLSGGKDGRAGTPVSDKPRSKERVETLAAEEERPRSRTSYLSRSSSRQDDKSKVSLKSKTSSQATYVRVPAATRETTTLVESVLDRESTASERRADEDLSSAATSVPPPPRRKVSVRTSRLDPIEVDFSPESAQDSSPKTPTQTPQFPPPLALPDDKQHIRFNEPEFRSHAPTPATDLSTATSAAVPPPPPPPPPALDFYDAPPRVDYLMQNGGLQHVVPKQFLAVLPRPNGTRPSNPPLQGAQALFAPFFNLLNQYQTVLSGHGSIAVATGHRTVARRLLDRLESVFSRDLPLEGCSCIVCEHSPSDEPHRGLGWGEVLERVSGRMELPAWPPFDLASLGKLNFGAEAEAGAAAAAAASTADMPPARPDSPVKMDPDIAEEFREHYLRQNKKVRANVDRWMATCAEAPAPPPQDVDDETLTFAILTSLDQESRPYFNALVSGARELQPAVRAPTPARRQRQDFLVKTGLALQRLYRLATAPRDAETALYLVRNRQMHDLLHTISDINPSEWEILISGRFDGFLWSGADAGSGGAGAAGDDDPLTPIAEAPSRGATPASNFFPPSRGGTMSPGPRAASASRNTTPFSRGPTPASFVSGVPSSMASTSSRQPVSNDEEAEIAALAEVEREIFAGMEVLEDAFEALHVRAEVVRNELRQRSAGLSMSLQQRKGGIGASRIDILPQSGGSSANDRPSWGQHGGADEESVGASESDDWAGDDFWDLAPEDSASNVSSSRHRRPKRRNERRTPAPIEEEEDE